MKHIMFLFIILCLNVETVFCESLFINFEQKNSQFGIIECSSKNEKKNIDLHIDSITGKSINNISKDMDVREATNIECLALYNLGEAIEIRNTYDQRYKLVYVEFQNNMITGLCNLDGSIKQIEIEKNEENIKNYKFLHILSYECLKNKRDTR